MFLCPVTTNADGKRLTLDGAWGMNQTSRLQFTVDRCTEKDGSTNLCESDAKIDALLRDLQIQTWIIHEHIDFRKMTEKPVAKQM